MESLDDDEDVFADDDSDAGGAGGGGSARSPMALRRMAAEVTIMIDTIGKLMRLGIEFEPLRDEIYCQLCKQTTGNRDIASAARGWFLMAVCLNVFPPSRILAPHLESYVLTYGVHGFEHYNYFRLKAISRLKRSRLEVPSRLELAAILVRSGPTLRPAQHINQHIKQHQYGSNPIIRCPQTCRRRKPTLK